MDGTQTEASEGFKTKGREEEMKLAKKEIIKALKTEPLARGAWIRYDDDKPMEHAKPVKKNCEVCAVGAVMREALFPFLPKIANSEFGTICDTLAGQYGEGEERSQPLQELSNFFENMDNDHFRMNGLIKQSGRKELIAYVKETFPNDLNVRVVL